MSAARPLNPGFIRSLETTNKLMPSIKDDGLIKLIAKVALIICTFGSIFLATIGYDLTKKIISKFRPSKPDYPTLEGKDKYMKYANKIYEGVQEGCKSALGAISSIPNKTARHFYHHQNPYNYIGQTAGCAISSTALLTLGGLALGNWKYGLLIGAALNGYGLISKPIENTLKNVKESIWPQPDIE
ncbi:MAG: hypothetical protein K940chlam1_00904 [Candidatus Anoxychlamydiales bacterium]|nr:hypothetical protein [Candidatus Anoxychlamydiales bacterium]NGX36229.1 hypothetical protein [Candidatus Anoxychlamydiales bacterium]